MACKRNIGIEVVHGTICKDRSQANVIIGYPDTIPEGQLSNLYLKVEWRVFEKGTELELEFRPRAEEATADDIRFDGRGGPRSRRFSGDVEQLVAIFGEAAQEGNQANTILNIKLNGEAYSPDEPIAIAPRRLPAGPSPDECRAVLQREVGIAAQPTRPAAAEEQGVWDRYNAIFGDARDFADALATLHIGPAAVPVVEGNPTDEHFNLEDMRDRLKSHRDPEGPANTKAKGKNNAFDLFQGHWRGFWRQKGFCETYINECQDQDRQETERPEEGGKIYLQHVMTGPDSRPYATPPEEGVRPTCFTVGPGRNFDIPGIYAINIETGVVVGAEGVKAQPDDDGVRSQRPHIGFYIGHGKLLWVAEEGRRDNVVTYSLSYEICQEEEREPIDDQRYTRRSLHFEWDRAQQRLVGTPETRAGQYRKILTEEERRLEQNFRERRLLSEHLQNMRYRRRLESLSSQEVQRFLDNAADAALRGYLERLLDFVRQQEALRDAPLGDRESITFIMGEDPPQTTNPFYTGATAYFTLNPTTHLITHLRTLVAVRDHLFSNCPKNGRPWGEINIVVHADEEGGMTIPVRPLLENENPATHMVNHITLREAVKAREFESLPDAVVDVRTIIRIRGCALGRSQTMLSKLSTAFGGEGTQRPVIRAPRHIQSFEFGPKSWRTHSKDKPTKAEEFFLEFWFLGFKPKDVPKNLANLAPIFGNQFNNVVIDWQYALSHEGDPQGDQPSYERRTRTVEFDYEYTPVPTSQGELEHIIHLVDGYADAQNIRETGRTTRPDGTVTITFDCELGGESRHGELENLGVPGTDAQRLALFRNTQTFQDDLAAIGTTIDDYSWTFSTTTETTQEGEVLHLLKGVGLRTIVRVERELREPDPDHPGHTRRMHPPVTDLTHFGEEVPAREAEYPLGENIAPP